MPPAKGTLAPVRALAASLLLALAVAACGGPDEPQRVRDALGRFERAIASRDYRELCRELLAAELRARLRSVQLPCETALREGLRGVRAPKLTVLEVEVDGDSAAARVRTAARGQEPGVDTVRLAREDGDWRIVDLAAAGPPSPSD